MMFFVRRDENNEFSISRQQNPGLDRTAEVRQTLVSAHNNIVRTLAGGLAILWAGWAGMGLLSDQ